MKIIDLLNKIAKNEIKQGTKLEIDGCGYIYNNGYIAKDDGNKTIETFYISQRLLNDEVEILEEEPRDINVAGSWLTKSEYDYLFRCEEEKKDNFTGWKMYQDGKEVCSMDCSVEEEKKLPEKLGKIDDNDGYIDQNDVIKIGKKVDEIIDCLLKIENKFLN